jgi:hypothetical protein
MDRITLEKLRHTFLIPQPDWCASLFMPTHRAGRETEQNPIRFRNLLRQAQEQLQARGLRPAQVQEMLKKPQRLLLDKAFWQRQSDGLAAFFSADAFHCFRLPLAFDELVVTAKRFLVKPLLPILTSDGLFFHSGAQPKPGAAARRHAPHGGRDRPGRAAAKSRRGLSGTAGG